MRKILTVVLGLTICFLCGCSTIKCHEGSEYNTAYSLGLAEYQMAVNSKLTPLISELQPIANAETIPHPQAAQALKQITSVYDAISALNPPKDKTVYQAELLEYLKKASDWLRSQYDSNVIFSEKNFADILAMIENSFNVTVN